MLDIFRFAKKLYVQALRNILSMIHKITLGIHIGHDRSAAIVRDGKLIAHLAQERIDRIKHSNSPEIPYEAIKKLLEWCNIKPDQISGIGISYTNVVIEDILNQLSDELRATLGINDIPIIGVGHHLAHAYSTYFTSDFNKSLILVADGAGDIVGAKIEAESIYTGHAGKIKLEEQRLQDFGLMKTDRRNSFYPDYMHQLDLNKEISIGRKYEQLTYLIGFKHGEAGKTMGLASYAKPLMELEQPTFSGLDFSLTYQEYLDKVNEFRVQHRLSWYELLSTQKESIASLAQLIAENYILTILNSINSKGDYSDLCLAGGVFLNCLLNQRILEKAKFKRIHIIPAAGDDGQSVGTAIYAYHQVFEGINPSSAPLPYLGISHSDMAIEERLKYFKLPFQKLNDSDLCAFLAKSLSEGQTVGMMRGRSEMGPRALCHRSIITDSRPESMKDKLNKLKGRELFRPFAPVVTAEDEFKYFELIQSSPYMLLATKTKEQYKEALAAVTHVDGTARVQSVLKEHDPFMHQLLESFKSLTGYSVLLNTSFNIAGDPIVESPHDAISAFLNCDLDLLVMENYLVIKSK